MVDGSRVAFGMLLRHFRVEAAMSQEALAEQARMSVETISALERGVRRSPYRETVALLVAALRLSAADGARLEAAAARPQRQQLSPNPGTSPLGGSTSPPHNLPSELSSLVGRDVVASEVGALVGTHRLVTLVGSGGVGKTRVALLVAENLIAAWPDGVWLVELASLGQPGLVVGAVAQVLGLQESPQRPLLESIVGSLQRKRLLMLLDNCEHVVTEVRELALTLLRACPNLRILATSQEPLRVSGEWTYRVPSLDYPLVSIANAAAAAECAAVRLFADRARAANDGFLLCDDNAPAVAEICRRLDGIPLALELAAARVRTFAPRRLLQMLSEGFEVVCGGDRVAVPRLQTMRAAIDWSFALLGGPERVLARRLGVFAGGWTLEAAVAVCSSDPHADGHLFEPLASLVDKSLVSVDFSNGEARYRFLESIRAYVLEQLTASGEREIIARRHAQWAAEYGEWVTETLYAQGDWWWDGRFPSEAANRREALEWAFGTTGNALLAGRIAGSGTRWFASDAEACRLIEMALARVEEMKDCSVEARLWLMLSAATRGKRSVGAARRAIALFEQVGERSHWFGRSLQALQNACRLTGQHAEALAASDRLLALLSELAATHSWFHIRALRDRAEQMRHQGRYEESRDCLVEAITLSEGQGERFLAKVHLAELELSMGNVSQASLLADEAAATYPFDADPEGLKWELSTNRCNASAYRLMLGEIDEAQLAALEGLELARRGHLANSSRQRTWATQHLATVAARSGNAARAAVLMGYVDAWYAAEGEVREETEQWTYEILIAALEERLSETDIERFATEGSLLDEDEAVYMALAIGRTPSATSISQATRT